MADSKLLRIYDIPLSNVVTHQHWSGKACPCLLLSSWDEFKRGIEPAGDSEMVKTYVIKKEDTFTSVAKSTQCFGQ